MKRKKLKNPAKNNPFYKKTATFMLIADKLINIFEKNNVESGTIKKKYICGLIFRNKQKRKEVLL